MAEALISAPPPHTPLDHILSNKSDGFELLCACATSQLLDGQAARIVNRDFTAFDGAEFLRLAEHHGVAPLVARNLLEHATLPAEISQLFRSVYEQNLKRNLWFAAELTRILAHLADRNLRAIPYKGPVLAQLAYGDLGLRNFSDLDLLISPQDFEHAKQALAEIGYRPSHELSPAVERLFLQTGYERSFDGTAGKNLVELQWNLMPYFYAIDFRSGDFRIEDLLARSTKAENFGTEITCLSPEDSLLVLCLHAAKHLWTRLIWVVDVAGSLHASKIDFERVMARARALGIVRIVGVNFWLVERLLGTRIPANFLKQIASDPDVQLIGEESARRLAHSETYDFESSEYFRHILHLRERMSDRWQYLWRLVWTLGPGEVAAIELPPALFPLYHFVRIGRLVKKLT